MAEPSQQIFREQDVALPVDYRLPPGLDLQIHSVVAFIDGAGAGSDFKPALAFYAQSGQLMGRVALDEEWTAGDSGVVTWAPFLRKRASAAPSGGVLAWAGAEDLTVTPGASGVPAFDNFERTDATIFQTSVTDGGAASDSPGDSYIRCTAEGVYFVTAMAVWSAAGANRNCAVYVSGGSSAANDDQTARGRTPAGFSWTTSSTSVHVNSAEAPVWVSALLADGGSGNSCQVFISVDYLGMGARTAVY